jgi:hypothetical protein
MKVSTLIGSVTTLDKIDLMTLKLSTAYKLNKILKECKLAVSDFEARRLELAKEHGKLTKDGLQYSFTEKNRVIFTAAMSELLDDDVELTFKKIPLADLDDRLELSPSEMPFVEWFIDGLED